MVKLEGFREISRFEIRTVGIVQQLYLDKTGTSILQRHGLEPVMVTTAILKEKEWNKTEKSWWHLGFIPDLEQKSRAAKARE